MMNELKRSTSQDLPTVLADDLQMSLIKARRYYHSDSNSEISLKKEELFIKKLQTEKKWSNLKGSLSTKVEQHHKRFGIKRFLSHQGANQNQNMYSQENTNTQMSQFGRSIVTPS